MQGKLLVNWALDRIKNLCKFTSFQVIKRLCPVQAPDVAKINLGQSSWAAESCELRTPDRRYRPCYRSPVVMCRAGSLRLALRAGFKLSEGGRRRCCRLA